MPARIDLTGQKFGGLTVLGLSVDEPYRKKKWHCVCECGKEVDVTGSNLRSGHSTQCKSCQLSKIQGANVRHGQSKTKLYYVWRSMLSRCENPDHKSYKDYGGRGIKVCEAWHRPEPFLEWAKSAGYCEGLEIDRIDNDGNYCPENCHWIPRKDNAVNKSNNKRIEYEGQVKTLSEWARYFGVNYKSLSRNVLKGYSLIDAVQREKSGDRTHRK